MVDVAPVSVSRRISAKPQEIFAIVADPNRHFEIDGSGMVRGAIDAAPVRGLGDTFAMKMHHDEWGDYEMVNTVVEYQPDRLITWEPARPEPESEHWHYRWRYELAPQEDGATVVTESFDLSHSPEAAREATKDGTVWTAAITQTLERLDHLCASARASQGR